MRPILTIFSVVLCSFSYSQPFLTPETLWKLKRISDPQLSADGNSALFNVRIFDVSTNKGNSDIYFFDRKSGNAKPLIASSGDESQARWMPDGKNVSFLKADSSGINQIFYASADGSNQQQLTFSTSDITNYSFASSGNIIWFTTDVKVDKSVQELYPDLPKSTGKIYDDLMMRHWNSWEDGSYSHLFIQSFENGKLSGNPKDIMPAERFDAPLQPHGGEEQIHWSRDGKFLAYTCKKLTGKEFAVSTNSDIYLFDVENSITTNISQGMNGYDVNPRFSPDGSRLMWLSMETPTYEADRNRIFVYDFKTKAKTEITAGFDYSVESAEWNADGKSIIFISGINATEQLWQIDLPASGPGRIRQITKDTGNHTAFTMAGSSKKTVIISSMMSISQPTELFEVNPVTGVSRQITFINQNILSQIQMGKVEKRMIKATDGKEILTWIIYPPGFDASKKYPALLYCQGGPQSTVSQFFSYRWNFQLMAANGYIVVAPNRRGLPSFGTEWNRQISGDWGGQCMKDYLSAIDAVSTEPYVNKDNLGCVGASFGGYSVFWLAGHHQKRFKTFIAHCGVFNLKSMYGSTEELWFPDFDLGGPYWKNTSNISYQKFSPNDYINNWDTPILVIHNEKDFRVPLGQGLEAFTAARVQNIPARFLYFPDEGHWVTKPQNSILWQRVFFDWLDKYLK